MADEFNKILEFFKLSLKEREAKFLDVFEDAVEYFERFRHIMKSGNPEEKKKALEEMLVMKKTLEEETQRVAQKTGLSEEQLAQLANDPKNFSSEQWEAIQNTQNKLKSGIIDIKKAMAPESLKEDHSKSDSTKKVKKRRKKPKDWISS